MNGSKSIRKFSNSLIKNLPFSPNNNETKAYLESLDLIDLLIHYLHWQTRLVPDRVREVKVLTSLTSDKKYKEFTSELNFLFSRVSNGESVIPFLSERAHRYGYMRINMKGRQKPSQREDFDLLLNLRGLYHFHLSKTIKSNGISDRSDYVLLAYVDRTNFKALGIFNHDVFNSEVVNGKVNAEREKMYRISNTFERHGLPEGVGVLSQPRVVMGSGHPMYVIMLANHYDRLINDIDKRIGDRAFVNGLYEEARIPPPSKYNLEWVLIGLDLCLFDKKSKIYFCLFQGAI